MCRQSNSRVFVGPLVCVLVLLAGLPSLAGCALAQERADLSPEQEARLQAIEGQLDEAQHKIVGGQLANVGDFPWIASIAMVQPAGTLFSFCGGALISEEWVVTAAHCKVSTSDKIILGRLDLTTNVGTEHNIAEVINHPDFNRAVAMDSDIALVRLATPSDIDPVGLITAENYFADPERTLTVAGWGRLESGGVTPDRLMKVDVDILTGGDCQELYSQGSITISGNMLCAGRDGKDSCQGDSGGPGVVYDPVHDADRLAGVVSFGIGCADPDFPGVYTRVANFLDFIEEHTGVTPPGIECDCAE